MSQTECLHLKVTIYGVLILEVDDVIMKTAYTGLVFKLRWGILRTKKSVRGWCAGGYWRKSFPISSLSTTFFVIELQNATFVMLKMSCMAHTEDLHSKKV